MSSLIGGTVGQGLGLGLGLPLLHTSLSRKKKSSQQSAQTDSSQRQFKNGVEMTNEAVAMTMSSQRIRPVIDNQSLATLYGR